MAQFLLRRLLSVIPVLLMVALIVFAILRLTPGDPAAIIAGDAASPEQIQQIRVSLGLDQPIYLQFFIWAGNLLQGDLGTSLISGTPVGTLIADRFGPSIALAI